MTEKIILIPIQNFFLNVRIIAEQPIPFANECLQVWSHQEISVNLRGKKRRWGALIIWLCGSLTSHGLFRSKIVLHSHHGQILLFCYKVSTYYAFFHSCNSWSSYGSLPCYGISHLLQGKDLFHWKLSIK